MNVTKKFLKRISWIGITVFAEESLVVFLCENRNQSCDFMKVLIDNDFTVYIGYNEMEIPAMELRFAITGLVRQITLADDKILRHFNNGTIKEITTGYIMPDEQIAFDSNKIPLQECMSLN